MIEISNAVNGDEYVVKLVGRLDVKAAKEVEEAFDNAAAAGQNVILDMKELDYIASAGLRAIKRLSSGVRGAGHTLTLRDTQRDVMDVFELTGFAAILNFE